MHRILMSVSVVTVGVMAALAAQASPPSRHFDHKQPANHGGKHSTSHYKPDHRPEHKPDRKQVSTSKPRHPSKPGRDARRKFTRFSHDLVKKHNGSLKYVSRRVTDRNYHKKYGKQFRFKVDGKYRTGWYYPGRHHRHWKSYCYNRYYRKWLFYDECTGTQYYYCGMCGCYRPIEYACQTCLNTPDDPDVDPCADGDGDADAEEEPDCCGNG
jgi:hypothetical protein